MHGEVPGEIKRQVRIAPPEMEETFSASIARPDKGTSKFMAWRDSNTASRQAGGADTWAALAEFAWRISYDILLLTTPLLGRHRRGRARHQPPCLRKHYAFFPRRGGDVAGLFSAASKDLSLPTVPHPRTSAPLSRTYTREIHTRFRILFPEITRGYRQDVTRRSWHPPPRRAAFCRDPRPSWTVVKMHTVRQSRSHVRHRDLSRTRSAEYNELSKRPADRNTKQTREISPSLRTPVIAIFLLWGGVICSARWCVARQTGWRVEWSFSDAPTDVPFMWSELFSTRQMAEPTGVVLEVLIVVNLS